MTLKELIERANQAQWKFSSASIPLKLNGKDIDVQFEAEGNIEEGYVINMKVNDLVPH